MWFLDWFYLDKSQSSPNFQQFVQKLPYIDNVLLNGACQDNDPVAFYVRGLCHEYNKNYTAAIQDYEQALALNPHRLKYAYSWHVLQHQRENNLFITTPIEHISLRVIYCHLKSIPELFLLALGLELVLAKIIHKSLNIPNYFDIVIDTALSRIFTLDFIPEPLPMLELPAEYTKVTLSQLAELFLPPQERAKSQAVYRMPDASYKLGIRLDRKTYVEIKDELAELAKATHMKKSDHIIPIVRLVYLLLSLENYSILEYPSQSNSLTLAEQDLYESDAMVLDSIRINAVRTIVNFAQGTQSQEELTKVNDAVQAVLSNKTCYSARLHEYLTKIEARLAPAQPMSLSNTA